MGWKIRTVDYQQNQGFGRIKEKRMKAIPEKYEGRGSQKMRAVDGWSANG
jgi:hypothetical protein